MTTNGRDGIRWGEVGNTDIEARIFITTVTVGWRGILFIHHNITNTNKVDNVNVQI